uniref:Response regulator n=1 Tax=Myoviridae sp. ctGrV43 TaxID=2825075 RepID=A0A8S5UEU7_9CAUD|nr:MAG TPA: response regulator [Myoviridae sp. ctGrV43]
MRIAICDDNQIEVDLFKEHISGFLRRKGDYRYEISEYSAGYPLVEDVKEGKWYDVIVLDMVLEKENGLEIANRLRDIGYDGKIIFWTADDSHLQEAFDVGAMQYVVKGKEYGRMYSAINEILSHMRDEVLTFKTHGELHRLEYRQIEYVESKGRSCHIYTTDNQCFVTLGKLDDIEEELCDKRFLRCHQSYLVNMDHIQSVNENFIMESGDIVQIRRRNHNEIKDKYKNYID